MKIDNLSKLRKMFKRTVIELTAAYGLIIGLQGILHLREHYSRRNLSASVSTWIISFLLASDLFKDVLHSF